jgi:hypothetical protein
MQPDMTTSYDIHPSVELRELFSSESIPYQGQDPARAKVVFVGLDANYSADIFAHENMRNRILEYHRDGVEFWKRHDTHHPFLLDEYPLKKNRGGVPYHRKFQAMGLTAKHAEFISFIELLDVPTIGSTETKKFWELFNVDHARRLDCFLTSGEVRLILLPGSVIRNMREANTRHGVFSWLPETVGWGKFHRIRRTNFHMVRHFSSSITTGDLKSMGRLIKSRC